MIYSLRTLTTLIACFAINVAVAAQDRKEEPMPVATDTPVNAQPDSHFDGGDTPATDKGDDTEETDASADAAAASNPLSSTSKLDLRLDYFDLDGSKDRFDINVKGDFMLHPRLKFTYEAHYWSTNVTGTTENDWESVSFKPILFVDDVKLTDPWQMRVAAGLEWIIDFNHADRGIGSGSDQLAPLFGLASIPFT